MMPCLITAPTRSAINETTREQLNNKASKNKNFTAKTEYLYLKAPVTSSKFIQIKT